MDYHQEAQGPSMAENREFRDGEKIDNRSLPGQDLPQSDEAWGNEATDFANSVERRFGVFPNFFRLAPETPEITLKLWSFAEAAYLDNPLPSAFKERLFVHLAFAQSATASLVMPASWWDLDVQQVIRMCARKACQTFSGCFNGLFHADKNFSRDYHCAQPARHQFPKCPCRTRRWKMPYSCWRGMSS